MHLAHLATLFFAGAVFHTLLAHPLKHGMAKVPRQKAAFRLGKVLCDVELIFGLWALAFLFVAWTFGVLKSPREFLSALPFVEPLFVGAILVAAATRPVLGVAHRVLLRTSSVLPIPRAVALYFVTLTVGPLLGSIVTEPAALVVTALILKQHFLKTVSQRLRYVTLAVLLVNVSIGGILTPFAAPPVVLVARVWHWGLLYLWKHFALQAVLAVFINGLIAAFLFGRELKQSGTVATHQPLFEKTPWWLETLHAVFLALFVLFSHRYLPLLACIGLFAGLVSLTSPWQSRVLWGEGLRVSFFLSGVVVLGSFQGYWLAPLIARLNQEALFLSATVLTSFTDNAALTYLGTSIPHLSQPLRNALVAGALAGGGLTVLANAPNPIAFSLLEETFGEDGIAAGRLFLFALFPTLVALLCFGVGI